jgi:hypothetical protein
LDSAGRLLAVEIPRIKGNDARRASVETVLMVNFFGVAESLLADFLLKQAKRRVSDARAVKETLATWNRFAEEHGSFADDHSTG